MKLSARGKVIEFGSRPLIMGIVNLCADSFSGDGFVDLNRALAHARTLLADGADMIDIGAESARTNRAAMSEEEEAGSLCAFIRAWDGPGLLSINTWRAGVAREALAAGGHLLNDLSGLPTDENARTCAETGAALLIMHTAGEPKVPQTHVHYDDILADVEAFFAAKIALAERAGVPRDAIVLDPGLDFAKQRDDNLRILRELPRLRRFGRPLLLPISRKTFIG